VCHGITFQRFCSPFPLSFSLAKSFFLKLLMPWCKIKSDFSLPMFLPFWGYEAISGLIFWMEYETLPFLPRKSLGWLFYFSQFWLLKFLSAEIPHMALMYFRFRFVGCAWRKSNPDMILGIIMMGLQYKFSYVCFPHTCGLCKFGFFTSQSFLARSWNDFVFLSHVTVGYDFLLTWSCVLLVSGGTSIRISSASF